MSTGHDTGSSRRTALVTALATGAVLLAALGFSQVGGTKTETVAVAPSDAEVAAPVETTSSTLAVETLPPTVSETTLPAATDTLTPASVTPDSSTTTVAATTPAEATTTTASATTAAPTTSTVAPTTTEVTTTTAAATTTTSTIALLPGQSPCPAIDGSSARVGAFGAAPPMCINKRARYKAIVKTSEGSMTFSLDAKNYPETVNNFVYLARYHFYDGLTFHRVIPDFVIQGGDPKGDGLGNPGYEFGDENPKTIGYPIGSLAMANGRPARPKTNGSQFFVVAGVRASDLPSEYPLFGKITNGTSVLRKIAALGPDPDVDPTGKPSTVITIESILITATGE